ncbi:MAG TPA: ribonuclease P protein component, partial [Afifellaceae bacterium]|nr:ribonuclease P protein component [Afifellaceae bacterium]
QAASQQAVLMEHLVMERLKKRRDYLAAARGSKAVRKAFILQARQRGDTGEDKGPARFGFTVTRRTARNAVDRNRIRRRLKAAAQLTRPAAGHDLVLIGRRAALSVPFGDLVSDLETAIAETAGTDTSGAKTGGNAQTGGRVMENTDGADGRGRQSGARGAARRQT